VKMVAAANFIDDPDHITVGQVIYFPSFELGG
jgi:nucleoid-associated protein YgaU